MLKDIIAKSGCATALAKCSDSSLTGLILLLCLDP